MSSRLTLRAKALSFSFFFTEAGFTSAICLLGCTRAQATRNPQSSSLEKSESVVASLHRSLSLPRAQRGVWPALVVSVNRSDSSGPSGQRTEQAKDFPPDGRKELQLIRRQWKNFPG